MVKYREATVRQRGARFGKGMEAYSAAEAMLGYVTEERSSAEIRGGTVLHG